MSGATSEQARSPHTLHIVGVWLFSIACSAALTIVLRDWLLFLLIVCFLLVTSAFVPKRPLIKALSSGCALGMLLALGWLIFEAP